MSDLVVVHHASSPSEAEVVRGVLEEAGIKAIIPDQNTPLPGLDLSPLDSGDGVIGHEVVVNKADEAKAKEVLDLARESGKEMQDE